MSDPSLEAYEQSLLYALLPPEEELPIGILASLFEAQRVTNSYKFFWFLALLEELQETQRVEMSFQRLVARMVSMAWYPVTTARLSLGLRDQLAKTIHLLMSHHPLDRKSSATDITRTVLTVFQSEEKTEEQKALQSLLRFVPYRLLTPWFQQELKGIPDGRRHAKIVELAHQRQNSPSLYCFNKDRGATGIILHAKWKEYLNQHLRIVGDYCRWNLLRYLERNNPAVPNLTTKLSPPAARNLGDAKKFWKNVGEEWGGLHCLYSGEFIEGTVSIDHFLPWSFTGHDLLWNLLPTSRSMNSSKSDNLPCMTTYFEGFADLQFRAVQTLLHTLSSRSKLLDDYVLLLKVESLEVLKGLPQEEFRQILYDTLAPQLQIARNMGFSDNWVYTPR